MAIVNIHAKKSHDSGTSHLCRLNSTLHTPLRKHLHEKLRVQPQATHAQLHCVNGQKRSELGVNTFVS